MFNILEVSYGIKQEFDARNLRLDVLKLQKILWYCAVLYFHRYQKHLFEENFKAWEYGVVLETTWLNKEKILKFDNKEVVNKISEDKKVIAIIKEVVRKKGSSTGMNLSDENHKQEPWKQTRNIGFDEEVTKDLIKQFASEIVKKYLN